MKNNKNILMVACACVFAFIVIRFFVGSKKSALQDEAVLVVGTAGGYAPFASVNAQGVLEGFDISMAEEIAARMNKKLVLKDLGSMTALFMALQQGKIDCIMWALSVTSERLKTVDMVVYAGDVVTSYPLIFWNKIPQFINSIDDCSALTICVEPGSSQEKVLNRYEKIVQKPMEKVTDSLFDIQFGKADAAFVEPAIAKKFQEKFPPIKILDVTLSPEDQVLGIGIALKKGDVQLKNELEAVVANLRSSGFIQACEQQWKIV